MRMFSLVARSFKFLDRGEKAKICFLVVGRCLASLLDLFGVVMIGYLATSIALFVSKGSDSQRRFSLFGHYVPSVNISMFPAIATLIVCVLLGKAVLSLILIKRQAKLLAIVEARAARRIAEKILGNQLEQAREVSRESLFYAATAGASAAFTGLLTAVTTLVAEGTLFAVLLATFFMVDWQSTIGVIIYFGLLAFAIQNYVGKRVERRSREVASNVVRANEALNDLHSGYRELAASRKRDYFFHRIEVYRSASAESAGAQLYYVAMPRYIVESALLLGVLALGGVKLLSGDLASSATTLGVFLTGGMRLMAAMLPWQAALIGIRECKPQAQAAQDYLPKATDIVAPEESVEISSIGAPLGVRLANVSYHYPGSPSPTLDQVNLDIEPGTHVALVGKSGAGKSTLADLIIGLIHPSSGKVTRFIDGQEFEETVDLASVSYVPQKPGVFSGTIAQNIAVGVSDEDINLSKVSDLLELVKLKEFIDSLPEGVNTDLGENRDGISGGQIQRVGLARALYTNPSLLILDEATSALDAETESGISELIRSLKGRVTVVTIAHRLNTIEDCDNVVLVDNGKIIDQGLFPDVVSRNSSLARAVELLSMK